MIHHIPDDHPAYQIFVDLAANGERLRSLGEVFLTRLEGVRMRLRVNLQAILDAPDTNMSEEEFVQALEGLSRINAVIQSFLSNAPESDVFIKAVQGLLDVHVENQREGAEALKERMDLNARWEQTLQEHPLP